MDFKELDDLLNFDYSGERPTPVKSEEELYAALRRESHSQSSNTELERRARQEAYAQQERAQLDAARAEAEKRRAQEEAYERYRESTRNSHAQTSDSKKARKAEAKLAKKTSKKGKSNNSTGAPRKTKKSSVKATKFSKILSAVYLVALAAFGVIMTIMNVLPLKLLIVMYLALGLLSFIIVSQLSRDRIKKWARVLATFMAVVLICVYGIGSAYALGTLSFLEGTSVKNENKVGKITEDPFNVIMTGIDVKGKVDEQGRSDVNMVVTVNPQTGIILLTSIPRDYEIRMPQYNYATDKLTHTGFYGTDCTIASINDLLDIEANYYVKVNFTTVKKFVNAIGGIDVYSEYEFVPEKLKSWTCKKGWNHMNGKQALAFARERHVFKDGDNQRVKNQQAVLEAMIKKAMSSKTMVISYSSVLTELEDYFEMSFSSAEIRSLVKLQLAQNPEWKIYKNTLYGSGALKVTYTGGSQELYVTEQNSTSITYSKSLINAVMEGKTLKESKKGVLSIVEDEAQEDN